MLWFSVLVGWGWLCGWVDRLRGGIDVRLLGCFGRVRCLVAGGDGARSCVGRFNSVGSIHFLVWIALRVIGK